MDENDFVIVSAKALPEIFIKVLQVKALLDAGKKKTVQEAVSEIGISRSAYYKYKDLVFPIAESMRGRTVTFAVDLENVPGLLSKVLNIVASMGANILTINQTIPINNIANVTITIEIGSCDMSGLIERVNHLPGVEKLKVLARE